MENRPLETLRAETEAKVSALRRETEASNAALLEAYKAQLRAYESARQSAKYAREQLDKKREEGESFRHRIRWKQDDIKNLRGLFNGKRRRQLEGEIAELESWARAAEKQLPGLERQLAEAEAEASGTPKPEVPKLMGERELTYRCAKLYEQAELYEQAAWEYGTIRGYRDVDAILEKDENIAPAADAALLAQLQPGNTVLFGRYRQNSAAPRPEPIEWIVLENDGKIARLLSRRGLFADCFNHFEMYEDGLGNLHGAESATWETCSLRRRLNGEFLDAAFMAAERAKLATVRVPAHANPKYPSDPGNPTTDRVYLLSGKELEKYSSIEAVRSCVPTQRAAESCGKVSDSMNRQKTNCSWWLRTPGQTNILTVLSCWPGNPWGVYSNIGDIAVRPAIALKLSELEHEH